MELREPMVMVSLAFGLRDIGRSYMRCNVAVASVGTNSDAAATAQQGWNRPMWCWDCTVPATASTKWLCRNNCTVRCTCRHVNWVSCYFYSSVATVHHSITPGFYARENQSSKKSLPSWDGIFKPIYMHYFLHLCTIQLSKCQSRCYKRVHAGVTGYECNCCNRF